jgi:hypothetical protein
MSLVLKADNRSITQSARYSFSANNYPSATANFSVLNSSIFAANQYVLLGNFGSATAEILKIASVVGNSLTFKNEAGIGINTTYAHPESTKVTILPYNQVKFYWTATTTFDMATPLGVAVDIMASDFFTIYIDNAFSTGYGWFMFYNLNSATSSVNSNAIPYAGFSDNTVKQVMDSFFSLLNNKELKQVGLPEAYSWMNEGYAIAQNAMNLVNTEYKASEEIILSILPSVSEYLLPDDFSNLLYVRPQDSTLDSQIITPIDLLKIPEYLATGSPVARYYLRGAYLGFVPQPTNAATYYYRYQAKPAKLTSYDDVIDLPDNGHFAIKDFMCYRAYQKLSNPNSSMYYKTFQKWVDDLRMNAITRDIYPSSIGIASWANV